MPVFSLRSLFLIGMSCLGFSTAFAQQQPPPAAVGVFAAEQRSITETTEVTGRIEAVHRVDLVARVSAFLEEQLFEDGAEVKQGQLLYRLERGPFEADLESKKAAVAEMEAQLANTNITLKRAIELAAKNAGPQSAVDSARATHLSTQAKLRSAQALVLNSQINLDYTEIRSPINGRIGRTAVSVGNVVGPSSGVLATVVSQDPMYVTFPMSVRAVLNLRDRYADKGWLDAIHIRLRLPSGKIYDQVGTLDFIDINVAKDTDTIILRGTISNPVIADPSDRGGNLRELTNNEFVTVLIESVEPRQVIAVPRAAILSDQNGDYVYVVGEKNTAQPRRIRLGQSTPEYASIIEGLTAGESVIVEGTQRIRPGATVAPAPMSPAIPQQR